MNPKPVKHLRCKESNEPGGITRFHGVCGKSGTASRDYPKDLDQVTCPLCAAKVPRAKLHTKGVR